MKILLITDIHYGDDVVYQKNIYKPEEGTYISTFGSVFNNYVDKIIKEIDNCDLAFVLGDMIADSKDESTDESRLTDLIKILKTKTPIKYVFGNHDVKNINKEKLESIIGSKKYYSFDYNNYHHIILDGTSSWNKGPHEISEDEYNWLKNDLTNTDKECLIYCHFPLDNQNMDNNKYYTHSPERASISNKVFIRNLFQSSGKVKAVFNGHTHYYSYQEINGIKYYTIPSFSENKESNTPSLEYGIFTLENDNINIEIKRFDII